MQRPAGSGTLILALVVLATAQPALAQTTLYLPTDRQTNGRRVRTAFRDSVKDSASWTVDVRRGKTIVALGVIITPNGLILTKLSEIQPATARASQLASTAGSESSRGILNCILPEKKVLEATIVARDESTDLALIKVAAEGLKTPDWAHNADLALGRWAVTPKSAGTVTTIGIVSAKTRAIPAEKISGVLGVQLDRTNGTAKVLEVFEDSGAEAAGMKVGDVITRCDDKDIPDGLTLITLLRKMKPGEEVTLRLRRDDKTETVKVQLTHPFGVFLSQFAQQTRMGTDLSTRRDGFDHVFSHDGLVDPDECGGAVLDLSGKIIGINIARAGRTETLALPVEVVEKSIARMQEQIKPDPPTKVSTERAEEAQGKDK